MNNQTVAILIPEVESEYKGLFGLQDSPAIYHLASTEIIEHQLQHLYNNQINQGFIFVKNNANELNGYLQESSKYFNQLDFTIQETTNINEIYCIRQLLLNHNIEENTTILLFKGLVISNINIAKLINQYQILNQENYQSLGMTTLETFTNKDSPTLFVNQQQQIQQVSQNNKFLLNIQKLKTCMIYTNKRFSGIYYFQAGLLTDTIYDNKTIEFLIQKTSNGAELKVPRFCIYKQQKGECSVNIDCYQRYFLACKMYTAGYFYPFLPDHKYFKEYIHSTIRNRNQIDGIVFDSQLGYDNKIESNTLVKNSIIMNNCEISQNCIIEDCLLHDSVQIEQNIILPKGSVIGPNVLINQNRLKTTIFFYLQNIWNKPILKLNGLSDNDICQLKQWMNDIRTNLKDELIQSLPPIYMISTKISRLHYDYTYNQINKLLQGQNVQILKTPLQNLTDFYEFQDNDEYGIIQSEESYESENTTYSSNQITKYRRQALKDQQPIIFTNFYIPDYLLKEANKTLDLHELYCNTEISTSFKVYNQKLSYEAFISDNEQQRSQRNDLLEKYNNLSVPNKIKFEFTQLLQSQASLPSDQIPFSVTDQLNKKLTDLMIQNHHSDTIRDVFRPQVISALLISSMGLNSYDFDIQDKYENEEELEEPQFEKDELNNLLENPELQDNVCLNLQKLMKILLKDKKNNNFIVQNILSIQEQIENIGDQIIATFFNIVKLYVCEVDEKIGRLLVTILRCFFDNYIDDDEEAKESVEEYINSCKETEINIYSDNIEKLQVQIGNLW